MIRIVADSTCDLSMEESKKLGISIVPLTINFSGEEYLDGIDLGPASFYQMLEQATALPTSSQANPLQFEQTFAPLIEQGDDIVVITISAKLSATLQSATIAANALLPERIHVVDSRSAAFGEALLVQQAVRMRDEGRLNAEQIATRLRDLSKRLRLYGVVTTLKYLKMGGRLSSTTALIGGALGITPIVSLQEGVVKSVGKVRGELAGMRALADYLKNGNPDLSLGIAFGNADASERMERYIEKMHPLFGNAKLFRGNIGSVIGTHTGPGVVGIAFFEKESAED